MPLTDPPLVRLLKKPWIRNPKVIGLLSALLPGGSLLAWAHFVEPRNLDVTRHCHPLADGEKPITILHLTDLHFSRDDAWSRRMLDQLQTIKADVVVITGDLLHVGAGLEVAALLERLPDAPLGRFACLGNWDRWSGFNLKQVRSLFEGAGIQLLVNATQEITIRGRRLCLVGVDDLLSGDPQPQILNAVPPGVPSVVLSHTPTLFPALAGRGANLVLSGHTHGGQVRAPFKGAVWMPVGSAHYDKGWFEIGNSHMYVSRGIGMSVAPLRFLCRPEAALIEV